MSGILARTRRTLRPLVRDLAGELLYRTGLTRPERSARDRLMVVTFHRVLPEPALRQYPLGEIAVTAAELAWFGDFFQRHYTCGSLAGMHRRWAEGERPPRPFLAITFDDGQLDNFEHARPVLDGAGLKATFFVPVEAVDGNAPLWHDRLAYAAQRLFERDRRQALGLLGELGPVEASDDHALLVAAIERAKRLAPSQRLDFVSRIEGALGGPARPVWDGLMSWEQLRALARSGHEVGSHSMSHAILPLVDGAQLEREITGSKLRLEAELGLPCESFCYPNGDCDERVAAAVRRAGYLRAVTTAWGVNRRGCDAVRLRRCDLQGRYARSRSGGFSEPRLALRLSPFLPGARP
jgi:peptidoglycan/xylan/chitin deacetylase (PgdA/CDA1 family)